MPSWLLFILAVAGMLCVVPACAWLATGRWQAAVEAARGYWGILGGMVAAAAVLVLLTLAASCMA